jgi:adenine-specific DNA-methyltransferase
METLNQMMLETPDLNLERLNKLKELFPDLFTAEGKLNENELRKLIETNGTNETERYDFRWFGKSQSKRNAFTPTNTTLIFDKQRSVNPEQSENLIIEGENLEVLKLLQCGYREKIKCIYIDPPYNTGKDFVYSDNYTEEKRPYWEKTGVIEDGIKTTNNPETSGRYHSDWLNMMYSRLLIARSLLLNDGVIFISIDDNEIHNLRKLCDDVFGEENFVATLIWQKIHSTKNDAKYISDNHEYILLFSKNIESLKINLLPRTEKMNERYQNPDNDPRGAWASGDLVANEERREGYYDVISPKTGKMFNVPSGKHWVYSQSNMLEMIADNRIWFGKDGNAFPRLKRYLSEVQQGKKADTLWLSNDVGHNQEAKRETKSLFDELSIFETAKPIRLLKQIIQISTNKNDLVLDFFGGSGALGQAISELNNELKDKRQYILIQIPELTDEKSEAYKAGYKKISDITIERNKRVVEKIIDEKEAQHPNLFEKKKDALKGLGFKVFQLVKSNFPRTEFKPDPNKSDEENIEALKEYIKEKERQQTFKFNLDDLLTEILVKQGFLLNFTYEQKGEFTHNQIFHATDGEKKTLICLDEDLKLETIEQLKETDQKFICLERALDTTKKWNLNHYLGDKFQAF